MKALLLFFLLPFAVYSQVLELSKPLKMLALGDSYTIGESVAVNGRWPAQLCDSLGARGISTQSLTYIATTGWRTDNLLSAVSGQGLEQKQYNLVSLLIGVNNQYQGKPLTQYKKEFRDLLDSAIRYAGGKKSRVMILSIPDYAYTPLGQQSPNPASISAELDQYNAYAKQVADSMTIIYFNITPISRQGINQPALVAPDGLHPSALQYSQWVSLMLKEIDKVLYMGSKELKKKGTEIRIFPNPVIQTFKLTSEENSHMPIVFEIIDALGSVRTKGIIENGDSVNINFLPEGVYQLRLLQGGNVSAGRLIKCSN